MEGAKFNPKFIFFFVFAAIVPTLQANIAAYDEVWRRRAVEAWNRTLESYEPEPEKIVGHLNMKMQTTVSEFGGVNSTRRELRRKHKGKCMTFNPIDRCWRCDRNWADNRKRLADCVLGFGYKTTGGKDGRIYVVTDPSDKDVLNPTPGTLRHAVIQKEPLWIIFAKSMVIKLKQELIMYSDKTIDARGVNVHVMGGGGITLQYIRNVIIHGLHIHDIKSLPGGMIRDSVDHFGFRTRSDGDGISLFGAQDVWIDHVSMRNAKDGLIDIIMGSTGITISNSHFTDHNEVMLFGANDKYTQDEKMQITVAFNHFGKRLVQRMPRCRFGYIHVVNNDYTHWNMYAIGGSMHPTIISQGNRYIAPPPSQNVFAKEITKREYTPVEEWKSWTWVSQGDLFLRGAFFVTSGDQQYFKKHPQFFDKIKAAPATNVGDITLFSGALTCKVGKPC